MRLRHWIYVIGRKVLVGCWLGWTIPEERWKEACRRICDRRRANHDLEQGRMGVQWLQNVPCAYSKQCRRMEATEYQRQQIDEQECRTIEPMASPVSQRIWQSENQQRWKAGLCRTLRSGPWMQQCGDKGQRAQILLMAHLCKNVCLCKNSIWRVQFKLNCLGMKQRDNSSICKCTAKFIERLGPIWILKEIKSRILGNFDGIDRLLIACLKFLQRWVIWVFFLASSRLPSQFLKQSENIQRS
jgi:hypothetical protein